MRAGCSIEGCWSAVCPESVSGEKVGGKSDMKSRVGFTLIEVLIVVVVLGILASIVAVNYAGATDDARLAVAKNFERQLRNGAALYSSKMGTAPLSFTSFMSFGPTRSEMSFLCVDNDIRQQFDDVGANVGVDGHTIVLPFKGGATATYTFEDGDVTVEYTGFGH